MCQKYIKAVDEELSVDAATNRDINTICLFADDAMVILLRCHWSNPFSSNKGEKVKDIAEANNINRS